MLSTVLAVRGELIREEFANYPRLGCRPGGNQSNRGLRLGTLACFAPRQELFYRFCLFASWILWQSTYSFQKVLPAHTTTGCGKQGFPSAQPYLSHTPGANPFCCMFLCVLSYDIHPEYSELPRARLDPSCCT
ncbi:hypothetical protein BP00DRAFT_356278 [Aspergillus indologenus CBS 114.80]|uniref:Uncharacterized protein n=1 Tax=Aspergillus indologenus CBS 114.80 TaxID=1450541 RepID=A0A2V5HPA6_9EURO|nr:hypothetical protein BP00DRAFT_356278 [Aspergillus indologenus CBS 114.80]